MWQQPQPYRIERSFKTGNPPVVTQPTSMSMVLTQVDTQATIATVVTNPMPGIFIWTFTPDAYGLKYSAAFSAVYNGFPVEWTEEICPFAGVILPMDMVLLHLEIHKPKKRELDWINRYQPLVENAVKKRIGYDPVLARRTDIMPASMGYRRQDPFVRDFDVRGNRLSTEYGGPAESAELLSMPHVPIRCVHHLWENPMAFGGQAPDDFSDQYLLLDGQDFYIDWQEEGLSKSGILHRIYMHWPVRPRTVKVDYTTGYTADELIGGIASNIGLAIAVSMQYWKWQAGKDYLPLASESIGGYSRTFAKATAGSLPREAQKLLAPMVHYGRFL